MPKCTDAHQIERSLPPASIKATLYAPEALKRLARTAPAEPAPTMMVSYCMMVLSVLSYFKNRADDRPRAALARIALRRAKMSGGVTEQYYPSLLALYCECMIFNKTVLLSKQNKTRAWY